MAVQKGPLTGAKYQLYQFRTILKLRSIQTNCNRINSGKTRQHRAFPLLHILLTGGYYLHEKHAGRVLQHKIKNKKSPTMGLLTCPSFYNEALKDSKIYMQSSFLNIRGKIKKPLKSGENQLELNIVKVTDNSFTLSGRKQI